jgi:peptide/nickel transport system substrate-binding protein
MEVLKQLLTYLTSILIAFSPAPQYSEGVIGQPVSFFPSQAKSDNDITISKLLYRGLFRYDIYGTLIPDLAETWEVSDDGLVYTITLKENQYWKNGRKINADDLIYTSFKVPDLTGVATDKVDDLKVRYTLPNKYAPFLSLMTVGIMPVNAEEEQNSLDPVSSGDFNVLKMDKSGEAIKSITLGSDNPNHKIKRIAFKYYSNEDELGSAAKLGEIDAFMSDKKHELENFDDFKFPLQGIYYSLIFNLREEKLQDLELRRKMEKILPINQLILERGINVQGPISRSVFTDRELEFDKYDELFKEDLEDIEVEITVPEIEEHIELAEDIRDLWMGILDIEVDIKEIPSDEMMARVIEPRNFEILLYGQEIGRDPDRYVYWHSTQKDAPNLNLSGFEHVRSDRALEEGRNEMDNDKRITHYNEFQKVVLEEVPVVFLYHPFKNFYVSKYITGVGEKYTFTKADRFLDFYNWEKTETN